jgi:hypothetical protein
VTFYDVALAVRAVSQPEWNGGQEKGPLSDRFGCATSGRALAFGQQSRPTFSEEAMRFDRFLERGGLAVIVVAICSVGLFKSNRYYGTLLRGFDAQFYYAAGRSAAVSGDWDVTDDLPLSPWQGPFQTEYGTPKRADGGVMNVFPAGLSFIEMAILVPARQLSTVLGIPDEPAGYTQFEIGCVAFGLLIIAAIGLQVMYAFARTLTTPRLAALSVLAALAGTPLLFQMAWFPFTPHPTVFTVMVLLLFVADRMPQSRHTSLLLLAFGTLAALLFLLRPTQSPYIILLTVWRLSGVCGKPLRTWLWGAVAGLLICLAAVAFQAGVHHLNLGRWSMVAQGKHDHPMISGYFNWTDPRFDVVFFSSARGVFWVTPLALVALAGYIGRPRSVPWWGWASLISAMISMSILAFWSDPWQGDSFGIRILSEHAPVVVCGLTLLLAPPGVVHTRRFWTVGTVTLACVAWTQLLALTYVCGRMKPSMTWADVVVQVVRTLGGHCSDAPP